MPHFTPVVVMAVAIVLTSASVAAAYVSGQSSGTYALAKAGSLVTPADFKATNVTTATLDLTWTVPTEPSGATVTDWKITQTSGTSTATSTCYKDKPTPGCQVMGLAPSTTYTWRLTYYVHTWQANVTVAQATTTVVVTATTVYTTAGTGVTESSCPDGDVAMGGGMYSGAVSGAAPTYYTGPVTAAVLATAVSASSTTLKFKTGGLPFAVTKTDVLLVGTADRLYQYTATAAGAAAATSLAVKTGTRKSGTFSTVPAGYYVFDLTSTTWRPPSAGSGTAPTSYGWYTLSTEATATAYLLCSPSSKFVPTTVYETTESVTPTITTGVATIGVAEASCPAGDVPTSGGIDGGKPPGDMTPPPVHMYFAGPVTAAVLSTAVTTATTTLKLGTGGLPNAVAADDYLLVGSPTNLFRFTVSTTAVAGATSVKVKTQKKVKSSSTSAAAGSYVYDITNTGWRPPVGTAGTAPTTYGWYAYSTYQMLSVVTAYVLCVPSSKLTVTTVYETTEKVTTTVEFTTTVTVAKTDDAAQVSCPVGDIAIGGGFYSGAVTMAAHPYYSGPVDEAVLAAKVTASSTTLTFESGGLPAAVKATDILLVGSPSNLDSFKVSSNTAAGVTTLTVKSGKNLHGSSTVPASSYVFDVTSPNWRPPSAGIGLAGTPLGWYTLSTEGSAMDTKTVTAYARVRGHLVSDAPGPEVPTG